MVSAVGGCVCDGRGEGARVAGGAADGERCKLTSSSAMSPRQSAPVVPTKRNCVAPPSSATLSAYHAGPWSPDSVHTFSHAPSTSCSTSSVPMSGPSIE